MQRYCNKFIVPHIAFHVKRTNKYRFHGIARLVGINVSMVFITKNPQDKNIACG